MALNRRNFLTLLGTAAGAVALKSLYSPNPANAEIKLSQRDREPYEFTPLPYDYDALEPYIDEQTMRFHHGKHYAGYTRNLNKAVRDYSDLKRLDAEELIGDLDRIPEKIRRTVRNNGGGYVNHKMFWEIMSPDGGGQPRGRLARAIDKEFGSFEEFKAQFNRAARTRFGSGWAWLVMDDDRKLSVTNTLNQDSPLMAGNYPVMGLDVWEHAYYLKYKNARAEYINNWWNVVNWKEVNKRYLLGRRSSLFSNSKNSPVS
ncbi:MAG: Fe-Mn family superoxide dismutase [Prochloraceae cyanobacterium]|nr:Fe-Mn family superoxide dismutase [Prochloraceae cyanobacterium]